jgi:hypothetical protein
MCEYFVPIRLNNITISPNKKFVNLILSLGYVFMFCGLRGRIKMLLTFPGVGEDPAEKRKAEFSLEVAGFCTFLFVS